jgi:hypothetical protein
MFCAEVLSPEKISATKLQIVKKYFMTLSQFRRFVINNKNNRVKSAIKEHVSTELKILGECAESTTIQRDCLILQQLANHI